MGIFPFASVFPAVKTMTQAYKELMANGTDACEGLNPRGLFTIVGLNEILVIERRAGASFVQEARKLVLNPLR